MSTTLTRFVAPELDDNGYMLHPEEWTEEVARVLAEGLLPDGLTREHWQVIYHLRDYYLRFGIPPPVNMLARGTGLRLKYIRKLFPGGLSRCACKIAGLPWLAYKHY